MKIKLPEKRFFSVAEVAARWEVENKDVLHLLEVGDLQYVPKIAAIHEKRGVSFYVAPDVTSATRLLFDREEEVPGYIDGTLMVITYQIKGETSGQALDRRHKEMCDNGDFERVVMLRDLVEFESLCAGDGSVPEGRSAMRDDSLFGVIAALMASFPKGKIPSARELEKSANAVGVKISDSTIEKALKAARSRASNL